MYLFEAILLGSTMKPQIYGDMSNHVGTCALGAAYDALGIKDDESLQTRYSFLTKDITTCPVCHSLSQVDYVIATHLNDMHHWTRERIAEWVATIEPKDETKKEEKECLNQDQLTCQ